MANEKSTADSNPEEDAKDTPVEDSKSGQTETESAQKETESSDTELEEVELRKPKSLSLRRVISRSVRGSIRLVNRMRPKSEGEAANKGKTMFAVKK